MNDLPAMVVAEVQRASNCTKSGEVKVRSRGQPVILVDLFTALESSFSGINTFRITLTNRHNVRVKFNMRD